MSAHESVPSRTVPDVPARIPQQRVAGRWRRPANRPGSSCRHWPSSPGDADSPAARSMTALLRTGTGLHKRSSSQASASPCPLDRPSCSYRRRATRRVASACARARVAVRPVRTATAGDRLAADGRAANRPDSCRTPSSMQAAHRSRPITTVADCACHRAATPRLQRDHRADAAMAIAAGGLQRRSRRGIHGDGSRTRPTEPRQRRKPRGRSGTRHDASDAAAPRLAAVTPRAPMPAAITPHRGLAPISSIGDRRTAAARGGTPARGLRPSHGISTVRAAVSGDAANRTRSGRQPRACATVAPEPAREPHRPQAPGTMPASHRPTPSRTGRSRPRLPDATVASTRRGYAPSPRPSQPPTRLTAGPTLPVRRQHASRSAAPTPADQRHRAAAPRRRTARRRPQQMAPVLVSMGHTSDGASG